MIKRQSFFFLFLLVVILNDSLSAKIFSNSYVSFQLPPNWNCRLEVTEWICHNGATEKSKEAIIVLTAKEQGPIDSLEQYEVHLKEPKMLKKKDGSLQASTVYQVKRQTLQGQVWIDGLHSNSEVQGYFTRYLATVKPPLALLITFTAHSKFYTSYSEDFMKGIQSLRVTANKNILSEQQVQNTGSFGGDQSFGPMPSSFEDSTFPISQKSIESSSFDYQTLLLSFLVLSLGFIGYFFLKRKK